MATFCMRLEIETEIEMDGENKEVREIRIITDDFGLDLKYSLGTTIITSEGSSLYCVSVEQEFRKEKEKWTPKHLILPRKNKDVLKTVYIFQKS